MHNINTLSFVGCRSYLVKGTLPKYTPPLAEQSMIDNKLDADVLSKSMHNVTRNFMADNLHKLRASAAAVLPKQQQG